jgi:DNA segregation ATPase FtsK/SpoIIIE, S-DNA-T family
MFPDRSGLDHQRLMPPALEDKLLRVLTRAAGAALLVLVALVWVALLTWAVTDPSLTHATGGTVKNWIGPAGAIISDLLLQTLGFASVILMMAPMFWGLELVQGIPVWNMRLKAMYLPVSSVLLAGSFSAMPALASWPLHHGMGGILGDVMLKLGSMVFDLINPGQAVLASGILFGMTGLSALAHSIGLEVSDLGKLVASISKWPRGSEVSWHQSLKSEAQKLRDRVPGVSAVQSMAPQAVRTNYDDTVAYDDNDDAAADWDDDRREPSFNNEPFHVSASNKASVHPQQRMAPQPALAPQHGPMPMMPPHGYAPPPQQWAPQPQFQPPFPPQYGAPYPHAMLPMMAPPQQALGPAPMHGPVNVAPGAFYPQPGPQQPHPHPHAGPQGARSGQHAVINDDDDEHDFDDFTEPTMPNQPGPSSRMMAQRFAGRAPEHDAQGEAPVTPSKRPAFLRNLAGRPAASKRGAPVYKNPPLSALKRAPASRGGPEFSQAALRGTARLLEDTLNDFGVKGEMRDCRPGPVVTLYEFEPQRGTKSSRIIALADDIARSMSVTSVRVAVVPGRSVIGIEMPNVKRETVYLRDMFESDAFKSSQAALPVALGKSISGEAVVVDLARMPHLLVAGTTGSGKSVGVNAMILSLLYKHGPDQCRMLMIDPKMLELSVYNGIPHLLTPVVTDPAKAIAALNWAVSEMEERYKRMSQLSVRNIDGYNARLKQAAERGERLTRTVQTGFDADTGELAYETEQITTEPMPFIVIIVDEFADLMAVAGKEIEGSVQRLAQMARAAGIHLIMATQRPSVDVITGTIKANFPTRISFKVTSKIDSRTILTEQGAEQLLGAGDMLYSAGGGQLMRVHGPFVADDEVEAIADGLRKQGSPAYVEDMFERAQAAQQAADASVLGGARTDGDDDLFERAVALVVRDQKASISYIQRRLAIGYNRAATLMERMEQEGLVGPANATGKRDILAGGG